MSRDSLKIFENSVRYSVFRDPYAALGLETRVRSFVVRRSKASNSNNHHTDRQSMKAVCPSAPSPSLERMNNIIRNVVRIMLLLQSLVLPHCVSID
jgi:hypothetical protein